MGSGKTTIVRQFIQTHNFKVDFIEVYGKKYPYTIDEKLNIVISGRYDRAICGGIDGIIRNKELMKEYIFKLIKTKMPSIFIFEAVMYGTTFKFSHDLSIMSGIHGYDFVAVAPIAAFDVNLKRIEERNCGKPIKVDSFLKQYNRYIVSTKELSEKGVKVKFVDTENYAKENMKKILEETIYEQ